MMKLLSRRDALKGVAASVVGGMSFNDSAGAQTESLAPAFAGTHQVKPLPFAPGKLAGLSEKLIKSHHENNYSGAVKALNIVEQRLSALGREKDLPSYIYGELKREELLRTGSVVLPRAVLW
jgi:superoxide dismutase, Fe-Mn family